MILHVSSVCISLFVSPCEYALSWSRTSVLKGTWPSILLKDMYDSIAIPCLMILGMSKYANHTLQNFRRRLSCFFVLLFRKNALIELADNSEDRLSCPPPIHGYTALRSFAVHKCRDDCSNSHKETYTRVRMGTGIYPAFAAFRTTNKRRHGSAIYAVQSWLAHRAWHHHLSPSVSFSAPGVSWFPVELS